MKAVTLKRGLLALIAAFGAVIVAMIAFHPVGEPWMWAALLVVYIPMLLVVVAVGLYLARALSRVRR